MCDTLCHFIDSLIACTKPMVLTGSKRIFFFLPSNPRWQREIACFCVEQNQFPLPIRTTYRRNSDNPCFPHIGSMFQLSHHTHVRCVYPWMNFDSASVCDGEIGTLWDNTKIYRWHLFTSHQLSMPNGILSIYQTTSTSVPAATAEPEISPKPTSTFYFIFFSIWFGSKYRCWCIYFAQFVRKQLTVRIRRTYTWRHKPNISGKWNLSCVCVCVYLLLTFRSEAVAMLEVCARQVFYRASWSWNCRIYNYMWVIFAMCKHGEWERP